MKFSPELIQRMNRESRREQGLPPHVQDPAVLRQIADLIETPVKPRISKAATQQHRKSA
jgi:hypothetical protein